MSACRMLAGGRADDPDGLGGGFQAGCGRGAVAELGGAAPGDRTMLDALLPAAAAFRTPRPPRRTPATRSVLPLRLPRQVPGRRPGWFPGAVRSSYLGERAVGHPDPGRGGRGLAPRYVPQTGTNAGR